MFQQPLSGEIFKIFGKGRETYIGGLSILWGDLINLKNFVAPFYGWGSTAPMLEPLWGGSLLFTTKFPEIPTP